MANDSVNDRAWGISREEYYRAFRLVLSDEEAQRAIDTGMADLETNPNHSMEHSNDTVILLTLTSPRARDIALRRFHISADELQARQLDLMRRYPQIARRIGDVMRDGDRRDQRPGDG